MATPVDHVEMQAMFQPDRLAVSELVSGRRWTYAEWHRAVARTATVLAEGFGIGVGDRVAALARNCAELLLLHAACARIGAIYVPFNWRLSVSELEFLMSDAEPKVLFGDAELDRAGLTGITIEELKQRITAASPMPRRPIDADLPSLILYTSGTSGRPKGALLSENNHTETAINFSMLARVDDDSVFLLDSPMFHIIGLISNVRPAYMRGGSIIISDGFDPARTLTRLADPALAVTHYFCVPQMASMLRAAPGFDPSKLRHLTALVTGGAPNPADNVLAWIDDGIALVNGFGMSETGTVFGMPVEIAEIRKKPESVGIGTPAIEAKIVDAHDREVGPGESGELLLRGPNVFTGYWRRDEANAQSFTADGWFRTGDIAKCDEDSFYYIVDRKKDMFISGGENVYPAEIEAILAGLEGMAEYAVVGVPDAQWGEVGHLAIVRSAGSSITADMILAHLNQQLARYKIPKHVSFHDSLPRTGSGKVQKTILRDLLIKE